MQLSKSSRYLRGCIVGQVRREEDCMLYMRIPFDAVALEVESMNRRPGRK
jgi:hypothetical protein